MLNEKIVQFHDGEKRREGDTPSLRQNAIQVVSNSTKTLTQGQGHVTKVTLSQGSPGHHQSQTKYGHEANFR